MKYTFLKPTACAALVAAAFTPVLAMAQAYPTKPVRVIVPFAPGGGSDITARQVSHKLSEIFKQQFLVDNRPGAGGVVGMELVAKTPADGYTIMMMSGSFSASSATHRPPSDPVNTIPGVAEFGITPFVLTVHPSLPAKTTKELIAMARAKSGDLTYATSGVGGLTHLATELLLNMTGTQMVGVHYKSTGAAMTDLLSGQAPIIVGSLLPVTPQLKTGKLRALGVTTAKRWYSLPDVPTVGETIKGYEVELWFGTMAHRNTPQPIIEALNGAINKILLDPEIKKNLELQGMIVTGGTPAQFNERIQREYQRWITVVKERKIIIK
ncbi:MAG: tripartite tricarboxylate transporter substrate binding protein [Betaproteobacteria bacterium]|nr:tripartite tricarboxylate transporter substrate binding protein [Betaproteobacteria bacterium]